MPNQTPPRRATPCPTLPRQPCRTKPRRDSPRHAWPRLTVPRHADTTIRLLSRAPASLSEKRVNCDNDDTHPRT